MNSFRNGFFCNCGKTLFWLFLIIIISLIFQFFKIDLKDALMVQRVDAATPNDWYDKENYLSSALIRNSSNSSTTDKGSNFVDANTGVSSIKFTKNISSGSYLTINTPQINNNYSYNIILYLCGSNSLPELNNNILIGNSLTNTTSITSSYSSQGIGSSLTIVTGTTFFPYCKQYNFAFDSTSSGNFMFFKFKSSYSSELDYLGIRFYPMGLSNSSVANSITNTQSNILAKIDRHNELVDNAITNAQNKILQNQESNNNQLINNQNSNTQQQIENANSNQAQTNSNLNKINDSINNDNVDDANNSANSFFESFEGNDYGLSDVITMPLSYITKISSAQCSPLTVPIPFVNQNAELPCMYSIYQQYFGSFLSVYQVITTGFIAYWVFINTFAMVRGFSNPFSDKVEVLEL